MVRLLPRRTAAALVLSALLTVALLAPRAVAPAEAAEASIVFAALQVLVDRHIESPDPLKLLAAAVGGLRQALSRTGTTERLDNLTATEPAAARVEFQSRFDQAAAASEGRLTEAELQYAAVRAMAASIGTSHTSFRDPAQMAERQRLQRNEPSYTGVGTRSIVRDGRFYFLEVFPDSPAERAGIRPLDRVVTVDGQTTAGMSQGEFSNRMRGPEGSQVTLTVQRASDSNPIPVTIVRGPILRPVVEFKMLDGSVGYLRFTQFSSRSSAQVRGAIEALQRQGMRGLVLDLRANPGGLVVELRQIASLLLPAGLPIAIYEDRRAASAVDVTTGGPALNPAAALTVIVDEGVASAGELLSAAIQEHGRGPLVGVRTSGAVLNSTDFPLPGGTAIQIPVRRVKTGNGVVLEGTGVRPDVVVVLAAEDLDRAVDAQMQRAIQIVTQQVAARQIRASVAGLIAEALRFAHGFREPVLARVE